MKDQFSIFVFKFSNSEFLVVQCINVFCLLKYNWNMSVVVLATLYHSVCVDVR